MKKLVIFDLDGTLLNTSEDLTACMNEMLKTYNLPEITVSQAHSYLGYGAKQFVLKSIGENNANIFDKCFNTYTEILKGCKNEHTSLYKGLDGTLKKLKQKGVKLALLSNKPHYATMDLYEKLLKKYEFDCVLGDQEGISKKPNPQGLESILNKLNVKAEDAVFVGDSEVDIQTSRNIGMDCISVLWGFRSKHELVNADATFMAKNGAQLYKQVVALSKKDQAVGVFGEFKNFITKGNVLDMAVGVIIGSAFSAIVSSLVADIITPLISLLTGGVTFEELCVILRPEIVDSEGVVTQTLLTWNYGNFIQKVLNFLLIALSVFAFVKLFAKIKKMLDFNEQIRANVQEKLDNNQPLNKFESKWLIKQMKKNPRTAPKRTIVKEIVDLPVAPAVEEQPKQEVLTKTEQLLTEILQQLKEKE